MKTKIKIISILSIIIFVYILEVVYAIQCTRQATMTPGDPCWDGSSGCTRQEQMTPGSPCSQGGGSANISSESAGFWIVIVTIGYFAYKYFFSRRFKF